MMLELHTTERQLIEQFLETLRALPEVHTELDHGVGIERGAEAMDKGHRPEAAASAAPAGLLFNYTAMRLWTSRRGV